MSDAWLDLLRLVVMGAVGLCGAWLGAQATKRKEWWGHRRELYHAILVCLMDLYIHSRHRLRLEEEGDPGDPNSKAQLKEATEKAAAAMTELQRAAAIAIVLGDDVRGALEELGHAMGERDTPEDQPCESRPALRCRPEGPARCRGYCETTPEAMSNPQV
jgi:hypothetical protein